MELSDIDLLSRDIFVEGVPHEWFALLRQEAPIYRHPEPDGPGFWVFTRHEDVSVLNRDWEHLSSDQGRGGVVGMEELSAEQQAEQEAMNQAGAGKMMLTIDPPEHTRYRKLVNRGFTPRVIRSLEEHLREASSASSTGRWRRTTATSTSSSTSPPSCRSKRSPSSSASRTRIGTSCSSGPTG